MGLSRVRFHSSGFGRLFIRLIYDQWSYFSIKHFKIDGQMELLIMCIMRGQKRTLEDGISNVNFCLFMIVLEPFFPNILQCCIFFIATFVGMIVIFSILAMWKTCCFRSNVTCCHVTYLSLKLFILVPLWFLRYFKFLDEEKKQFDVVESFHMKNVLRRQPLHDYYKVPTPNHFVEHEK